MPAIALALVMLGVAACGSDDGGDSDTEATGAHDEDAAFDESGDAGGPAVEDTEHTGDDAESGGGSTSGGAGDDADVPATPASARTGRRVIRTAELSLNVEDPGEIAEQIFDLAARRGGFVAETDLSRDDEGVVRGSVTLRVPSAELEEMVEELDRLATSVPVRRIDERDVTSEATDLEARIRNLTNYERELNELLTEVQSTTDRADDLLAVFERIRDVREEIEQLEARLAVLSDQVALSTIHVNLQPDEQGLPVADPNWRPGDEFREALSTTTRALQGIADGAIWLVVTVLPVLLVIGVPVAIAVRVWRRRVAGARDSA